MNKRVTTDDVETIIELCQLSNDTVEYTGELTPSVIQTATHNGVAAWIYNRHKSGNISGLKDGQLEAWKSVYFINTIKYQQYLAVYAKIQDLLTQNNIPVLALKGMALASDLYHDDGLRPMSDIDVLVPEGKGTEALDVLLNSGCAQTMVVPRSSAHEQVDAHVRAITIDGVMVEIHQRLFSQGSVFYLKNIDRFKGAVSIHKQGIDVQRMNDVLMGYHLVAHAIKGIKMGGLRLGWLLDIALLFKKVDDHQALMEAIIQMKPAQKKELQNLMQMALLFLPAEQQSKELNRSKAIQSIAFLMEEKDMGPKHRLINFFQLLNSPGLKTKAKLVWREFIPQKEYMVFRYQSDQKESVWRLYIRRLCGRLSF